MRSSDRWDRVWAVSYTHLDVYKRQPLKSAPSVCPVCQNRTQTYRKEAARLEKTQKKKKVNEKKSCLSLLKIP